MSPSSKPMIRQPRRPCRSGYTLIEVILVVTIITLLTGIGFAVGFRVRENARQSTCISHLRQIGQALSMYSKDYDEPTYFLPPSLQRLYPDYASDRRIFRCPNDNQRDGPGSGRGSPGFFPVSYGYQYMTDPSDPDSGPVLWPVAYPRRGDRYPIVLDPWHSPSAYIGDNWLVLRLDGSVQKVHKHAQNSVDL